MCKWNASCINIWKGCYGESSDLPAGKASVNFNQRANYRADLIWWNSIDLSGHWVRSPISLRSYCRHFFRLWSCLILGISKGISNTIFAMLTSQRMNRKDNWEISHPKLIHCCWNERGVDREHAHLCKPPLGKILQTNSLYNFCTGLGKILDVVNRSAHHSNKKAKDENCCTARGWPSWTLGFCAPSWFMSFLGAAGLMVLQINFMDSRSLILL